MPAFELQHLVWPTTPPDHTEALDLDALSYTSCYSKRPPLAPTLIPRPPFVRVSPVVLCFVANWLLVARALLFTLVAIPNRHVSDPGVQH